MGFRAGDQSMSVRTVSTYLAVPERTVRHWARTGVLAGRRCGKRWLFEYGVVAASERRLGRTHRRVMGGTHAA
jgi:excisionase family DNA binding protein